MTSSLFSALARYTLANSLLYGLTAYFLLGLSISDMVQEGFNSTNLLGLALAFTLLRGNYWRAQDQKVRQELEALCRFVLFGRNTNDPHP